MRVSLAAILLCAACGGSSPPPAAPASPQSQPGGAETIGRRVQLALPSLDGVASVELASMRGRPLVVHFSTTGSLVAQVDIEEIRRVRRARRDLQVIEVSLDPTKSRLIRAWADASRIDWVVLLATRGLVAGESPFGPIRVTPTTFLLDSEGRIVWGHEGELPRGGLLRILGELDKRGRG